MLQYPNHNHNHPPNEADIHIRKCISDIKLSVKYNIHSRQMIDKILSEVPDFVKPMLPSDKALKKCLQRSKQCSTMSYKEMYSMFDKVPDGISFRPDDIGNLTHLLDKKSEPMETMKVESYGPTFSLAGLAEKQLMQENDANSQLVQSLILMQLQQLHMAKNLSLCQDLDGASAQRESSPMSCTSNSSNSPQICKESSHDVKIKSETIEFNDNDKRIDEVLPLDDEVKQRSPSNVSSSNSTDDSILKLLSIDPELLQNLIQKDSKDTLHLLNYLLT